MSLDTNALARIIAVLVKEEVDGILRDVEDLRAENVKMRDMLSDRFVATEAAMKDITTLTASVASLSEELATRPEPAPVALDLDALEERIEPFVMDLIKAKMVDEKMVIESVCTSVSEMLPGMIPAPTEVNVDAIADTVFEQVKSMVPEPVPGKDGVDGKDGKDGIDGKDRPVLSVERAEDGERVEKGTIVAHNGGLWTAIRKSKGTPTEDPASFDIILNGPQHIESEILDERTVAVKFLLADGTDETMYVPTHAVMHKGQWRVGEEYVFNDEVMTNGSTWRCVKAKTKDRPGESADWKLSAQGKPGKKGQDSKVPGPEGRGITEIVGTKSDDLIMLAVNYTDGTTDVIEFDIDKEQSA